MAPSQNKFLDKLIDKFSNSRDFTISFVLHLLLILIFGTTVLFKVAQPPPDFEGDPAGFVPDQQQNTPPPPPQQTQVQPQFNQVAVAPAPAAPSMSTITTSAPSAVDFSMNAVVLPPTPTVAPPQEMAPAPPTAAPDTMSTQQATAIKAFTSTWSSKAGYRGTRTREFNFTAYIGQYEGGNWNSTIQVANGEITTGSLPNLLYFMSVNSQNKIKTNYKQVKAINLGSDEIFTTKPPFIFFTGTKDFKLTDQEVENLRKYIQLGGCIWGDSSVPGARSSFDIAFRREMKRVMPDVDKKFEPLPPNHPIYTDGYYSDIKAVPTGLNYYQEPVYALKIYGQIAILYTANDYGDMWQFGLDDKNQIDLRKDAQLHFVAVNWPMFKMRGVYIKNVELPSLIDSYRFGTNVVIHLLTRWEEQTRNAPSAKPL